ncbi:CATRA conflict system CASPASE/TPR repeat-associated protein [Dactylosporangium sp. CA-139066]|uniref:CATRA conflict system CASPASE/TPR repeat-associated protein n=1 Tax=Dactylosporangium sp. CA-139066 TaxID=3239930 RepID=UPI003D92AA3B
MLAEHELVAHLFAPLSGPGVDAAVAGLESVWGACRDELGMTRGIAAAGLPARWPVQYTEGPLAGLQDPPADHQAILRRERDALNLSLVMAAPLGGPAPTWRELAGRWSLLGADAGALLGVVTIFQAKSGGGSPADELPARDGDARGWWTAPVTMDGFTVFETGPVGTAADRRLVVLGRPGEDEALSRFTWSGGDTALPPLGRYLMHAAWLRYHARVRGDGEDLRRLREDPAAGADVAYTLERLRLLRRAVEITQANMTAALGTLLPADAALSEWLTAQLADDLEHLSAAQERLDRVGAVVPPPPPPPVEDGRIEFRMIFGVDVIGYSGRSAPEQEAVQARVAAQVERVLERLGVASPEASRQPAGDGMMVVLPASVELHRALPALVHGWRSVLAEDNAAHPGHRIRLRLSATAGPIATASMGYSGSAIVEAGRLLDGRPLRDAATDRPDADVVTMISDRLYQDVIGEGHPGLPGREFVGCEVENKTYSAKAWLWTGPS